MSRAGDRCIAERLAVAALSGWEHDDLDPAREFLESIGCTVTMHDGFLIFGGTPGGVNGGVSAGTDPIGVLVPMLYATFGSYWGVIPEAVAIFNDTRSRWHAVAKARRQARRREPG